MAHTPPSWSRSVTRLRLRLAVPLGAALGKPRIDISATNIDAITDLDEGQTLFVAVACCSAGGDVELLS